MSTQTSEAVVLNLNESLAAAPAESIVSRSLYGDDQVKAVLFSFAPGQELSEHTAATPAILHILQGEAELTLGGEQRAAGPGHLGAHARPAAARAGGPHRSDHAAVAAQIGRRP